MEPKLIYGGEATLEDMYELHDRKGYEFVIQDGKVTNIWHTSCGFAAEK